MQPFQRGRHQGEHRERKIKSIAKSVWIYHGTPSNRERRNWQEAEEICKRESTPTPSPSPVLAPALLGIALATPYPWLALPRPIQVNDEISWVILALISSFTLSHVSIAKRTSG